MFENNVLISPSGFIFMLSVAFILGVYIGSQLSYIAYIIKTINKIKRGEFVLKEEK